MSDRSTAADKDLDEIRTALAGRYRLDAEIGRGGMAVVFHAVDLRHERAVALKIMRADLSRALGVGRFLQEIQIESRLSHPGIVPLHDSGEVELSSGIRCPYYVMPLIQGQSLRELLDRYHQLPVEEARQIATEVAEALAYAHEHGVVHRDIKPQNILLADGHAVVADFGIARAVSLAGGPAFTSSGLVIGTPGYMSPEQSSAGEFIDGRSDIYALGCVLYEMLTGSAPFHGATQQAVIVRHLTERPPGIQAVRPTVGPALEAVVMRCLEKVPADRYATAREMVHALADAVRHPGRAPARGRSRPARVVVPAVLVILAGIATWVLLRPGTPPDPRRVVVFPFRVVDSAVIPLEAGEAVATYIGHGLEQTDPLKWLDGWTLLSPEGRDIAGRVSTQEATAITRAHRARWYITGQILRQTDSLTVIASLFDSEGDTLVRRAGSSAPADLASLPQLGLRAVGSLLPALLAPGRRVELGALADRRPSAVAHFLQGEAEYRRMRFAEALPHYELALQDDSSLAIAALRAAEAANWEERFGDDSRFIQSALSRARLLPARDLPYARGLEHYFAGRADEALRELNAAVGTDSSWTEAWTALGEVYFHLFPRGPPLDSLAAAAFRIAVRSDSGFSPAVHHLAQLAVRFGNMNEARRLAATIQAQSPASPRNAELGLLLRCMADGPGAVDWQGESRRSARSTLGLARWAGSIAHQIPCAEAGFRAVLESPATLDEKWGALLALSSLLVASGRGGELAGLSKQVEALAMPGTLLYLLAATVDTTLIPPAQVIADERAAKYGSSSSPTLWLLGEFEASRGSRERVGAILTALKSKRDSAPSRRDSLLVRIMEARELLVLGDSAKALDRLRRLLPSGRRQELEWQPWESLGPEFVTQAELLLKRGEPKEAWNVASRIDSPYPVTLLMFLPRSLAIRRQAALDLGARDRAGELEKRLVLFRPRK